MSEKKDMTAIQRRSAATLIRAECANYYGGACVRLDTPCPQCHSFTLICKYFRARVLPLDGMLHAEVMGGDGVRQCASCKRPFRAVSNRAKYCAECAAIERRKREAARQRMRRRK